MKKSKRLTSKSGLTIPKDMRIDTGFFPGMAVDLEPYGNGILVTPHVPLCRFCGSPEDAGIILGMNTCRKCRDRLRKELQKDGD